ncbi:hypothetical protein EV360DRAFT_76823, partial [Lentinula raphanica]
MNQIQDLSRQLSSVSTMRNDFLISTRYHDALPSDNLALIVLRNLEFLLKEIQRRKTYIEVAWWKLLDECPTKVENLLTDLMNETRNRPEEFWKTVPNISFRDFSTLGPGRWLNDEIINYFIDKWCFRSRNTLGFGTFFAGTCLFQDNTSCLVAKRYLTVEDENRVKRCVIRRQRFLDLENWDTIFIPIHEGSSHWYSVRIDFVLKRIDIYDSLQETCIVNRQKPISKRKNTNIMLVLMWLTEILASMRGESVCLTNNPQSTWVCDPHSKVPFQPNAFDCGVHTLWHLKHVLEYREVNVGCRSNNDGLSFTNDMDCSSHIKQKQDDSHVEYRTRQDRKLNQRFKNAVKEATRAQIDHSPHVVGDIFPDIQRRVLASHPPAPPKTPSVEILELEDNDDDFLSDRAMDVDSETSAAGYPDDDTEGEILCSSQSSEEFNEEEFLHLAMNTSLQELFGADVEGVDSLFNFLPEEE